MSKDKAVYIGSTPRNLTRAANEMALKQFEETNKKLIASLSKIKSNEKPTKQFI